MINLRNLNKQALHQPEKKDFPSCTLISTLDCKIRAQILSNGFFKQSLKEKFAAVFALFFSSVQENCFQI